MSNKIKKITSFFFILLGFVPMLFVFLFMLKQQSVRNRMKNRLEEEMLHTITLADGEIRWTEEGKEILVDGRMFDVKSIEQKDGMSILYGLFDDEETALNKSFSESWKKKSAKRIHLLAQLFKTLRSCYFSSVADLVIRLTNQQYYITLSSPKLVSQFKLILTPPPQA